MRPGAKSSVMVLKTAAEYFAVRICQSGENRLPDVKSIEQQDKLSTAPQTRDNPLEFKIEKILVPLDFSPASMEALDYAVSMAKQFHAAIHLVHVYPPDEASSAPGAGHLLFESAEAIERLNEELTGIHRKHVPTFSSGELPHTGRATLRADCPFGPRT